MARRVNIFGQPLSYDVAVEYVNGKPVPRSRPINPDNDDVSNVTKQTVIKYTEDLTHGVEGNRSNANAFPVGGRGVCPEPGRDDASFVRRLERRRAVR
jgi:hypothetical protein